MPIIYAGSNDGVVTNTNAVSDTARNGKAGTAVNTTAMQDEVGFSYSGGYKFERAFLRFDTRAITTSPSSAELKIYFNTPVAGDFIVVKATDFSTLTTNNFGAIIGRPSSGTYSGAVTDYSSNFTPTPTSYNTITLNSTALNDIGISGKSFTVCLLNYTYDYLNGATNPSINAKSNIILNDFPGTDFDAYLDYVEGSPQRQAVAGATATRSELRDGKEITAQLDAATDYEVKLVNNSTSQVYFNFESAEGKQLFSSASIRTTTSDSGSNVVRVVSESIHAAFILKPESTSSFFISSSTHNIPGNNFEARATNSEIISLLDSTSSGSIFGVDMEFVS